MNQSIFKILSKFSKNIGIDLGSSNILFNVKDRGIVINEPSIISIDNNTNKVIALGDKAKLMLGRNPKYITVHKPIKGSKIFNFDETFLLLKYYFEKIQRICGLYPQICVSVPSDITEIEEKAIREVLMKSGAGKVYTIEIPHAAALGAGLSIDEPEGYLIVDIGSETTHIAVLSLDGIVISKNISISGKTIDNAIIDILKKEYSLLIGSKTAEEVKIEIGTAIPFNGKELNFEIRGRDISTGLPRSLILQSNNITKVIIPVLNEILDTIKDTLDKISPELSSDIIDNGIILTGGTALIKGIDKYFSAKLNINVSIANEPMLCVAKGTLKALELMEKSPSLKKILTKTP